MKTAWIRGPLAAKIRKAKPLAIAAVFLFSAGSAATAGMVPDSSPCHGYRYMYIAQSKEQSGDGDSKVEFHACRRILQPSSIPADCELVGRLDTKTIS